MDRRRFLADCPRNLLRNYQPSPVHSVNMGSMSRKFDTQLSDIQYRLSGFTQPLVYFLHRTLQQDAITQKHIIDFVNAMHELLMDTASQTTQTRIDNLYRGTGMQGQAPRLDDSHPAPLLDLRTLLEHISLQKSLFTVGRRPRPQSQRIKPNLQGSSNAVDNLSSARGFGRAQTIAKGNRPTIRTSMRTFTVLPQSLGQVNRRVVCPIVIQDEYKIPFTSPSPIAVGPPSHPIYQSD
ncbi:hypothetical protein INT43_000206 [Umbelopsis isabellina]|uniref:Uncharacterized protein n=1 Tax=Mortierella isabellina TaxID=91625 RepID=A0A8H7PF88_MORIS|nr:hypothetical protein INT43_000206 [Umbelopsis isabellina]